MGRWTYQDDDSYRLPDGFTRIAYDANTRVYTYRDEGGRLYEGEPGASYGLLTPLSAPIWPKRNKRVQTVPIVARSESRRVAAAGTGPAGSCSPPLKSSIPRPPSSTTHETHPVTPYNNSLPAGPPAQSRPATILPRNIRRILRALSPTSWLASRPPTLVSPTPEPPTLKSSPTSSTTKSPISATTKSRTPATSKLPTPIASKLPTPTASKLPTPTASKLPTLTASKSPIPATTKSPTPVTTTKLITSKLPTPTASKLITPTTPDAPTPHHTTPTISSPSRRSPTTKSKRATIRAKENRATDSTSNESPTLKSLPPKSPTATHKTRHATLQTSPMATSPSGGRSTAKPRQATIPPETNRTSDGPPTLESPLPKSPTAMTHKARRAAPHPPPTTGSPSGDSPTTKSRQTKIPSTENRVVGSTLDGLPTIKSPLSKPPIKTTRTNRHTTSPTVDPASGGSPTIKPRRATIPSKKDEVAVSTPDGSPTLESPLLKSPTITRKARHTHAPPETSSPLDASPTQSKRRVTPQKSIWRILGTFGIVRRHSNRQKGN